MKFSGPKKTTESPQAYRWEYTPEQRASYEKRKHELEQSQVYRPRYSHRRYQANSRISESRRLREEYLYPTLHENRHWLWEKAKEWAPYVGAAALSGAARYFDFSGWG